MMKRKATLAKKKQPSHKIQKQEATNNVDLMNIDFLLTHILSFVPAYRLVGKNAITSVSKKWKKLLTENKYFNKKSFKEILSSCQQHPEGALHILSDETLISHFTFKQIIRIAGYNKELAKELIGDFQDSNDLVALSGQYCEIAMDVVKDPERHTKLTEFSLYKLGLKYTEVALYILKNAELRSRLSNDTLIALGQQHLEVANYLHDNPGSLTYDDLLLIDSAHYERAENIVKTQELCNNLNGEQLAKLGQQHLNIAKIILERPTLCKKLNVSNLCMLAENHSEISKHLLSKDEFCDEVSREDLMLLHIKNIEIANLIFDNAKLFIKLDANAITLLGAHHLQIAQRILKMSELQLSPQHLCSIGRWHSEVAEHILNTPALCDELSGGELAKLGKNHERIAKRIINTPTFWDKLTAENLIKLSRKHPKIIDLIINNRILIDKIITADLLSSFGENFAIANFGNENLLAIPSRERTRLFPSKFLRIEAALSTAKALLLPTNKMQP